LSYFSTERHENVLGIVRYGFGIKRRNKDIASVRVQTGAPVSGTLTVHLAHH